MGYRFGVGREAPVFSTTAHDGSEFSLKQYRGNWMPVLVFMPATSPDVVAQLTALSAAAGQIWGMRGQLVGILDASADGVSRLAGQAGEVTFPLIADPLGALAQKFGAWNPVKNKLEPLSYIVDKSGKIVWAKEGTTALDPATLLAGFFQTAR